MKYPASADMLLKIDLKVESGQSRPMEGARGGFCAEFTSMAYLAFPLQLRSEPLEVAVSPPNR